ncbi:MAG TPA: hypothetical protein VIC27_05325 [Ktedonobacterales bacterium]|jgi:hypothetical protein
MVYQVLTRASAQAVWEPYQAMTRDPLHAMTLLQRANRMFAEVSVIQAESAALLREQVRRLRAGEPSGHEVCPLPSLTATPRVSMAGTTIEHQRWAIEQGPGGDHDLPYHFETPISAQTLARWARLMVSARQDNDDDTLAELAAAAEAPEAQIEPGSASVAVDPAITRHERIG